MCLGSVTQGVVKFWLLRLSFSSSSFNQTEQHSRYRTTPCDRHGSKIHAKDIASSIMKTTVCSPSPTPPPLARLSAFWARTHVADGPTMWQTLQILSIEI